MHSILLTSEWSLMPNKWLWSCNMFSHPHSSATNSTSSRVHLAVCAPTFGWLMLTLYTTAIYLEDSTVRSSKLFMPNELELLSRCAWKHTVWAVVPSNPAQLFFCCPAVASDSITSNSNLSFQQNADGKGDSKVKKGPLKPLKILEEDDEDLSALKDPSEKVSISLIIIVCHSFKKAHFEWKVNVGRFRQWLNSEEGSHLHSYILWGAYILSSKTFYVFFK